MPKRKGVQALMLSVVAILMIYLLAAAISLTTQKPINKMAKENPIAGVQATVVNKAMPKAKSVSAITDADGGFDLGALPAGTYSMTLQPGEERRQAEVKGATTRSTTNLGNAKVTIEGTTDGTMVRGWDFKEKKSVDLAGGRIVQKMDRDSNLRSAPAPAKPPQPDITFTTNGKQKIKVVVHDMQ